MLSRLSRRCSSCLASTACGGCGGRHAALACLQPAKSSVAASTPTPELAEATSVLPLNASVGAGPRTATRAPNRDCTNAVACRSVGPRPVSKLLVATGARLGDRQAGKALPAPRLVDMRVGSQGLADARTTSSGWMAARGGAPRCRSLLWGGRRFRFRSLALDLDQRDPRWHSPDQHRYVVERATRQVRSVIEQDQSVELACTPRGAPRLPRSLRPPRLVGVDGDIGLGTAKDARVPVGLAGEDLPSDMHRLPAWSMGLALGATVGTL